MKALLFLPLLTGCALSKTTLAPIPCVKQGFPVRVADNTSTGLNPEDYGFCLRGDLGALY